MASEVKWMSNYLIETQAQSVFYDPHRGILDLDLRPSKESSRLSPHNCPLRLKRWF